ncbi:MAG: phosphoadenosine phosphosulfate reductase [Thermoprotei archaeon]|nr:MAG: phosphoadenosine phosphosulfate reductase [Thermoprotei archaeon]
MINIIVRSSRDADAVKAMLRTFYPGWNIGVYTLHGARRLDEAVKELESLSIERCYYVILLGREDSSMAVELDKLLPLNVSLHIVPRSKIRNARIEHLAHEFDVARSKLRLAVEWSERLKSPVFGMRQGIKLEGYEYNPAYDVFIGIGKGFRKIVEKVLNTRICENPVLIRKFNGVHDLYCGTKRVAVLEIPDEGFKPSGKHIGMQTDIVDHDLNGMIRANTQVLEVYESLAKSFLQQYREWADTVIVPWSGGKDSTATLLLVLSVFPRSKVRVLFSDTGTEFPWTLEYVEEIAEKLGIEVYRVYAGVDRGLLEEGMPMPTHTNRWCTGRKIASITAGIARLSEGNTLIVTGDRDAESRRRSVRPPVRKIDENTYMVSPIKLWSAAHVQLYILKKGFKLNPLYEKGFYRIGCYICPALRSWELYVVSNTPDLSLTLGRRPLYRKFLELRATNAERSKGDIEPMCDMLGVCG